MGMLDVLGPVMIGPSSSHTAGACRLALLARHASAFPPTRATFTLHGSFAKTARGHGTDLACVAGILGMQPDDERLPHAFEVAAATGVHVEFQTADLGDVHPNTVRIDVHGGDGLGASHVTVVGSSVGGGTVRVFDVDGFGVSFTGASHTLLVRHDDRPGVIARVARVIADDEGNIATLHSARKRKGGEALMSIELDKRLAPLALAYLSSLSYVRAVRMLPEVMSGDPVPDEVGEQAFDLTVTS